MSVCLSVCLSVIVLLLNGKRSGHVNGTDRSAIYRVVFVYINEFSPATIPGTIGQKPETASHLSVQNYHIPYRSKFSRP